MEGAGPAACSGRSSRRICWSSPSHGKKAREIDPLETIVTVRFEEKDGRTLQHFHQTPFSSVASRDSHVAGWNSLFNKEAAYAVDFPGGQGTTKS